MTAGSENLTEVAQRMLDEIGDQRPVAIWEKVGTALKSMLTQKSESLKSESKSFAYARFYFHTTVFCGAF